MSDKTAAVRHRDLRNFVTMIVARTTQMRVNTDVGNPTRRVLKVEYPNPEITMLPNCIRG